MLERDEVERKSYYRLSEMTPRVPPSGNLGVCSICKQEVKIADLPTDERQRNYFLRWRLHPSCFELITKKLDIERP